MAKKRQQRAQTAMVVASRSIARGKTLSQHVRELFEQWLVELLTTSVDTYRIDLQLFAAWRGHDDAADAIAELVQIANENFGEAEAVLFAYRKAMTEQPVWNSTAARDAGRPADRIGLANATINRRLSAIRSFVKVLRRAGRTEWTPATPGLRAKKFRDTEGVGAVAVRMLLDHLDEQTRDTSLPQSKRNKAIRDFAMICLMANMALRKISVRTLDLQHADELTRRVCVLLKGDEDSRKWKGCDSVTWDAIVRWIKVRGRAPGPLFTSFCRRVGPSSRLSESALNSILIERAKELELSKRAKPHGFRHTAITRALEAGMRLEEVSRDFADHAKIETTMVYDDRKSDGRSIAESVANYREDS